MRRQIDKFFTALVLVRLGQELGTASPATQAVHDVLDLLVSLATTLTR